MRVRISARLGVRVAILGFALLATSTPAFAQGKGQGGGLPKLNPEEIQKKVNEFLDKCDTVTCEQEGVCKLTYKAVPTSPDEILKTIGDEYKDKIPKGYNIDDFLKAYQGQIQDMLNTYLADAKGFKFEAFVNLKWKQKKLPKGEYKVSLVAEGEELKAVKFVAVAAEVKPGDKPKPPAKDIPVYLRGKAQKDPFPKLHFEFKKVEDKKNPTSTNFDLWSQFFRTEGKTTDVFKIDAPAAPKPDAPAKPDAPDAAKPDAPKPDAPKPDAPKPEDKKSD